MLYKYTELVHSVLAMDIPQLLLMHTWVISSFGLLECNCWSLNFFTYLFIYIYIYICLLKHAIRSVIIKYRTCISSTWDISKMILPIYIPVTSIWEFKLPWISTPTSAIRYLVYFFIDRSLLYNPEWPYPQSLCKWEQWHQKTSKAREISST